MTNDEAKFRELIAKRLEEIADRNEKDSSHDAPPPAWIAGIRDAADFVKGERFDKREATELRPTAKDKLIIKMSQRICTCGHRGHEHHAKGYSCERCICPEFYLMHLAKGPYDNLTPVPIPSIPPVEIACVLNAASSNGIVHLECEIKDRPLEETLEIQIRLSELESVYRYLIGGLDDEGDDGNPIIRPMTGFDVWDITRSKVSQSCKKCGHTEAMHVNDGLGCMDTSWDYAEPAINSFPRCHCPKFFTTAEQSESVNEQCSECSHSKAEHEPVCMMNHCSCPEFTRVSQFESYSRSAQSERSSQSQEPQLPARFQCKYQHGQIVEDLLVHMDCIQESGLQAWPATDWEQFFLSLPARWKCEEAECQVFRTLVARALNNLRLVLMSSRPTRRAHPNSASPTE